MENDIKQVQKSSADTQDEKNSQIDKLIAENEVLKEKI